MGLISKNISTLIGVVSIIAAYLFLWPLLHAFVTQKDIPALNLRSINGINFPLHEEQAPTIVYFWATWCQVCEVQTPEMIELAKTHKVVFISADSGSDQNVAAQLTKEDVEQRLYVNDVSGELKSTFTVYGYPTTIILQGSKTQFVKMGRLPKKAIESKLTSLDQQLELDTL